MQTILGAGGAVGIELAKELQSFDPHIRLFARQPRKINDTDELVPGDLLKSEDVDRAVQGASVVYLVAGLPYSTKTWTEQWPVIMKNTLEACARHKARLVFFDNVYMYDENSVGNLTEENPVNPHSKKGKVRAAIAGMVTDAIKNKTTEALIARAADFYGPGINTSVLLETVYKNYKKGKKANWLGNPDKVHSFTYVPDAAKATALLGNTDSAFGQVWHLPTHEARLTGKEYIALFAEEMNRKPSFSAVPTWVVRVAGLFNPFMKELGEMMYQYTQDYFFNSTKFHSHFPHVTPTPYEEGIRRVVMHP